MTDPDLTISEAARDHVRETVASWRGDNRDLALALTAMGHSLLLILDGRTDHIALYEQAARSVVLIAQPQGTD
ncbi:hypothetical protein [Methylobacterium flocculans]|uniref:hypothetical protein n=1 Tax=Methylobacterium flocculans TaxID=2984843 RepID=UPI0021F2C893|nr:hypothetical protein [Methylobacterium sp. FF17]